MGPTNAVAYTVVAILPDEATRGEYLEWLEDGHVDAVIKAGAHSAMIVRVVEPADPLRVEARYVFANRAMLDTYLAQHAPELRAEGLRRFPPSRGVRFERSIGVVV